MIQVQITEIDPNTEKTTVTKRLLTVKNKTDTMKYLVAIKDFWHCQHNPK